VDLSGVVALEQVCSVAQGELEGLRDDAPVAFVSVQGTRGL
jgi:hypothetical protein